MVRFKLVIRLLCCMTWLQPPSLRRHSLMHFQTDSRSKLSKVSETSTWRGLWNAVLSRPGTWAWECRNHMNICLIQPCLTNVLACPFLDFVQTRHGIFRKMIPNTHFPIKSNQIRNDECAVLVIFRYFSIFQKNHIIDIQHVEFLKIWTISGLNQKAIPDLVLGPRRQSGNLDELSNACWRATEKMDDHGMTAFPYLKWWARRNWQIQGWALQAVNCWVFVGNFWVCLKVGALNKEPLEF